MLSSSRLGVFSLLALLIAVACGASCAAGTRVMIPLQDRGHATQALLEAYVYRPEGPGPFPVAVLNHGSAGGDPKTTFKWEKEAAFLVGEGYLVITPMRRGRGQSTGNSPESEEKNCDEKSWLPGLVDSMRDLDATIDFSRALPGAKPHAFLLLGVSRGGFLSVAYAARGRYKADIRKVINLVGGWVAQAEDQCPKDFNLTTFKRFGRLTKVPMLWLYGAGDLFYGDQAIESYIRAFRSSGGNALFYLIEGVPENGHWLPSHLGLWKPYAAAFLAPH